MQKTTCNATIERARDFVRNELGKDSSGHDWWHIHRVATTAVKLANQCAADPFVVELAALLHDIGDYKVRGESDEPESAPGRRWLAAENVDAATIDHVCEIIDTMSFKGGTGKTLRTVEGKVVQDADRLDAIGAVGIARAFAYGGHKGRLMYNPEHPPETFETVEQYRKSTGPTINHFHEKLLLLKDLLNTDPAKKLAEGRHQFMLDYLARFEAECSGDL